MAFKRMVGFETGDTSEANSTTGTVSVQTGTVRSGTYALRVNPTTNGQGIFTITGIAADGSYNFSGMSLATAYLTVYFRVATAPGSSDEEILVFQDTNNSVVKMMVRLTSARKLAVYDTTVALQATGTTVLSLNTWYRLDIKCGTGAATAPWEVNIDGTLEISGTGNLATTNTGSVRLGKVTNRNSQTVDFFYDDVFVDDAAYIGAHAIVALAPNGAGTFQTWTIGAGGGSNYTNVDEIPPNGDTDYLLSTGTAGNAESETMADSSSASITGTVNAVEVICQVKRDGASNGSIKTRMRSGTTNNDTNGGSSTSSYLARINQSATDPNTSAAWTTSGVDGVEGGMVENSANKTRLTSILLMVSFTSSAVTNKTLAASCSGAAAMVLQPGKILSASCSAAAAMVKSVGKIVSAASTGSAAIVSIRVKLLSLLASSAGAATVVRSVSKVLRGATTGIPIMLRSWPLRFIATSTGTARALKQIPKSFQASVSGIGLLATLKQGTVIVFRVLRSAGKRLWKKGGGQS